MRIMNQSCTFTLCIKPYYVSEERKQLSPEAPVTQIIISIQCDQNVHHLCETSVCKNHLFSIMACDHRSCGAVSCDLPWSIVIFPWPLSVPAVSVSRAGVSKYPLAPTTSHVYFLHHRTLSCAQKNTLIESSLLWGPTRVNTPNVLLLK